jgi:hypothetical protein
LPKTAAGFANIAAFAKAENAIYRVIRGTAEFKEAAGKSFALAVGDTVTAGKTAASRGARSERCEPRASRSGISAARTRRAARRIGRR